MDLIFFLMMITTFSKGWLLFNNVQGAQYIEHILYLIMMVIIFIRLIFNRNLLMNTREYRKIRNVFVIFIILVIFLSLIRIFFVQYVTVSGIAYEVYKLIRNTPIFLYGFYFLDDRKFIKVIKIYIIISTISSVIGIFQYLFGLPFYELIKFAPKFDDYPQFYLNYLSEKRSFGIFEHPNTFGEFVSVAIFILIYSKLRNNILIKNKVLYYLTLLLNFVGLFVSTSRMSLIAVVLTLMFISVKYRLSYIRKFIYSIGILTFPILIFAINKILYKLWQYNYYGNVQGIEELRVIAWKQCFDIFYKTAGIGSGLGTWGDISAKFSQNSQFYKLFGEQRVLSDSYLAHLIAENGIFTFAFLAVVILLCKYLNKLYYKNINNRFYCITSINIILFIFITLFKGMSLSLFDTSFFCFMFLGYSLKIAGEGEK